MEAGRLRAGALRLHGPRVLLYHAVGPRPASPLGRSLPGVARDTSRRTSSGPRRRTPRTSLADIWAGTARRAGPRP